MRKFLMRCGIGFLCLGAAGFSQEVDEPAWQAISRVADEVAREREQVGSAVPSVCMFDESRKCIEEFEELDKAFVGIQRRFFRAALTQGFLERISQLHMAAAERLDAMRRFEALRTKYKAVSSKATSTFINLR